MTIIAGALLAAGCQAAPGPVSTTTKHGVAELPAQEIAALAVTGLTHNYPMRLNGRMVGENGQQILTLDVVRNFSDGKGTVQLGGFTVQLLRVGGHDYAKADEQFWISHGPPALRAPASAALADAKWVKGNLYDEELPVGVFLDLHDNVWEAIVNDKSFAKGGLSVVNGVPTVAITSASIGTVYVATEGEPNVIRVESPDGSVIDYSEHGNAVAIAEPLADAVVDIEDVKSAGAVPSLG